MRVSMDEGRRRLRVADAAAADHAPVCGTCGGEWPCSEERYKVWMARRVWHRQFECWACGKDAKSPTGFQALLPSGLVITRWCGPAKHRRCAEVGAMFCEADQRCRALRPA